VTGWGVLLLLIFFALGLSRTTAAKAMMLSACITAVVLTAVMASYVR
jgi:hypothetical protein